jgi:hypothetical protein
MLVRSDFVGSSARIGCLAETAIADEVRAIRPLPHIPLNIKQPPVKRRACGMRPNGELLIMSRRG